MPTKPEATLQMRSIFIQSIQEDFQPLCTATDGRVTVEMITAVLASHARNGERITFPFSMADNPFSDWH